MKQLKVALPDDLRARLDDASEKSGRSVAEEIRVRLETSLERDVDVDKPSTDFLENVARMAAEIARETGANWHQHAGAHEVLTLAIQQWLEPLKPKGPTAFGNRPHATVSTDDPRQLAALIVYRLRRQPGFTSSQTRQWMEEEHLQRMGSPRALLDTPQQQRDQQKKRGK
jgi:predicted DNA-binding protein